MDSSSVKWKLTIRTVDHLTDWIHLSWKIEGEILHGDKDVGSKLEIKAQVVRRQTCNRRSSSS
jgi:hypothetical protein